MCREEGGEKVGRTRDVGGVRKGVGKREEKLGVKGNDMWMWSGGEQTQVRERRVQWVGQQAIRF